MLKVFACAGKINFHCKIPLHFVVERKVEKSLKKSTLVSCLTDGLSIRVEFGFVLCPLVVVLFFFFVLSSLGLNLSSFKYRFTFS